VTAALASLGFASACALTGCQEDYTRDLDDHFPAGGFGFIDGPEQDFEVFFRGVLQNFHVAANDIDCMVERAKNTDIFEERIGVSGPELDAFAAECDVDISDLWYSTD
jgi:hypothetical protein